MRFLNVLAMLPALTLGSPANDHQLKELPDVGTSAVTLAEGISLYDLPHGKGNGGGSLQTRQAVCPPNFPLYCRAFGFCCPRIAVGCCQLACCAPGATFCQNGHCYGPAKKA